MKKISALFFIACVLLAGCATTPRPHHTDNICRIFNQYPDWYKNAKHAEKKWGVPVAVQMAIIYQESGFSATAQAPRKKLLWIIPWKRPSSAYGYSQALKNTWKDYEQQTGRSGRRNAFEDATDFIGWYGSCMRRELKIRSTDAYTLYLAYHEGPGGYAHRSYLKQPWLMQMSRKVAHRADTYQRQLNMCHRNVHETTFTY